MRFIAAFLTGAVALLLLALPAQSASGPKITPVTSPGGITAWLVQDSQVPVIALRFMIPGGGALDPADKKGLANMVSGLLDEGAGELDSLAFQTRLEDMAMGLSFSSGRDNFGGRLRTLSQFREEAFEMLRLALTEPRFDEEPVERIRRQILTGLIRDEEDPDTIASRTWFATAFAGHPYARPNDGTPASVKAITVDDLRQFVRQRLHRQGLLIGVVGDISPDDLGRLLDKTFGALPATAGGATVPDTQPQGLGETKIVRQNNPQSRVIFGAPGIPRGDPDWYAAYVMNYIVGGGGMTTRLFNEVREKRGLAYSVYTYLYGFDHTDLILGGVGTANERLNESIETIRAVLNKVRDEGFTAEELADAKTYLNGSFPLNLTSGARIAGMLVSIQKHKLGLDYLSQRPKLIDAVTLEDLKRVAKRLLKPDKMLTVIVGNPPGE